MTEQQNVRVTNDAGDALLDAWSILQGCYRICLEKRETVPDATRRMIMSARDYIDRQYRDWLRGETR